MHARLWAALLLFIAAAPACGARTGLPDLPVDAVTPLCGASSLASAAPAPVDLSVVLDSSLSMGDVTSADVQKWGAVTLALEQFMLDPRSAGAAVSLTFFPRLEGDATPCSADADCPGDTCGGARRCRDNFSRECSVDADCEAFSPGDRCHTLGVCTGSGSVCDRDESVMCAPIDNLDTGLCSTLPVCHDLPYCRAVSYREPDVPLQPLPDGSDVLRSAMLGHSLGASTPMLPAISGALDHARLVAPGRAGRVPVLVLATDGQPNACDLATTVDAAVAHVAAVAGLGRQQHIATFVVGVLSAEEQTESQGYLDSIAEAGASRPALIVSTGAQLTSDLLAALSQIRQEGALCSYALPDVSPGTLDPAQLVVTLVDPAGASTPLARQPGGCGAQPGYQLDTDIFGGDQPGRLQLCPGVCQDLAGSPGAFVSIKAGCL